MGIICWMVVITPCMHATGRQPQGFPSLVCIIQSINHIRRNIGVVVAMDK